MNVPIVVAVPAGEDAVASSRRSDATDGDVPIQARSTAEDRPPAVARVRGWSLWSLPTPALAFVLGVDTVALVLGVWVASFTRTTPSDLLLTAVLAFGVVVHLEAARHIESIRHVDSTDSGAPYIDAKSMWSFAGLILLPAGPALILVLFTLVYWWVRVSSRPPPHRWVYSAATVVIGSCAALAVLSLGGLPADGVVDGPATALTLVAAALVRWTVNHGLVVAVLRLTQPASTWTRRLGSVTDNLIGLGALALGIALAVLVEATPWLVPVLLVPVLAMHRGVLLGHFARAARTDPKTGLATAGHWHDHAQLEIARARRRHGVLGVLMLDLDGFKTINDRWGHLAGDQVLRAVADVLRGEVRPYDAIGRFGGEEFVVLLAEVTPDQLRDAAERIRRRISECEALPGPTGCDDPAAIPTHRLTVSIGAAPFPSAGADVDELLAAADRALYAAKHAGRDRVRLATPHEDVSGTRPTP